MPRTATVHRLKTKTNRLEHLNRDRGYRWEDRDPDMEWLCNEITRSGKSVGDITQDVREASKGASQVSYGTIQNWLNGKTRRPQNFTLTWVSYALGYERRWTKLK